MNDPSSRWLDFQCCAANRPHHIERTASRLIYCLVFLVQLAGSLRLIRFDTSWERTFHFYLPVLIVLVSAPCIVPIMPSGKPFHFPPHEINKKPSDLEPSKSYEKTAEYLNDDNFLTMEEEFHHQFGDLAQLRPPKSLHHANRPLSPRGGGGDGAAAGSVSAGAGRPPPQDAGGAPGGGGGIQILPSSAKSGKGNLHGSLLNRNVSSFDDAKSLKSSMNDDANPDHSAADDALARSPGSFPSFPTIKADRAVSAISTLTTEEELQEPFSSRQQHGATGGRRTDYDFLSKWSHESRATARSEAMVGKGKNRAKNKGKSAPPERANSHDSIGHKVKSSAYGRAGSYGSIEYKSIGLEDEEPISPLRSPPTAGRKQHVHDNDGKAKKAREAKKNAKYFAKKRTRMRDMRYDAMYGDAEYGHDGDYDIEAVSITRSESQKNVERSFHRSTSASTLGGRRVEQIKFELGKASVTKRLLLRDLNLTAKELPLDSILSDPLGSELTKISLAGNLINHLPEPLVYSLNGLKTMDLQQCGLVSLPDCEWVLPNLRRLNLSYNSLKKFLPAGALRGLPNLEVLTMSNNDIYEIDLPEEGPFVLENLEYLSLAYNHISDLPEGLTRLFSLKTLRLPNNYITHVPRDICKMELSELDVTMNPIIQPPLADCERGIAAMRRYFVSLDRKERRRSRLEDLVSEPSQPIHDAESSSNDDNIGNDSIEYGAMIGAALSDDEQDIEQGPSGCRYDVIRSEDRSPDGMGSIPSWRLRSRPVPAAGATQRRLMGTSASSTMMPAPPSQVPPSLSPAMALRGGGGMPTVAKVPLRTATAPPLNAMAITAFPPPSPLRAEPSTAPQEVAMSAMMAAMPTQEVVTKPKPTEVINDTLKLVFVGQSRSGKTTAMNRLKAGMFAEIPNKEESTIGISIDSWNPAEDFAKYSIPDADKLNASIVQEDESSGTADASIRFSLFDFAGQQHYHATHSIFFSPSALYVLVWNMGADNKAIEKVVEPDEDDEGEFQWIDSDEEVENEQNRRNEQVAEKALDDDIDEKVQYWIDCIRSSVPGAAILFVASHADCFDDDNLGGIAEARRRCRRMKERILRREERRVQSLRKRLLKLENSHRADSPAARRIRELLSPYRLPKLIFQNDGGPDSVMRISGTFDRGFGALRKRVINLATGRETECEDFRRILSIATGRDAPAEAYRYPLFRGHVGAVIPPERLAIRALVREKRAKFQLLEWSSFAKMAEEKLGYRPSDTDLNDTLRFLSRIGEILFFGEVDGLEERPHIAAPKFDDGIFYDSSDDEGADEDGDYTVAECDIPLSPSASEDNMSITGSSIADLSLQAKVLGMRPDSLSQFIFINPRWLVLALKLVMRHDLSQHLEGVKSGRVSTSKWANFGRADSFFNSAVRCPILRDSDARLLWANNTKLFKSAIRAVQGASPEMPVDAFSFLEKLLVYFGVFVPIDLMKPNVELSNELYSRPLVHENDPSSVFYFLPSQLKPRERPRREIDEDTFKTTDEKKVCLCHTWLFRDGAPPGVFERITSSVLRALHTATASPDRSNARYNGQLEFDEILCWRQAFQLTLKTSFVGIDNRDCKSYLDVFAQIEDQASETCVAGDSTAPGLKRLVISGMGLESQYTRLIWQGGFNIILDEADRTIREYRGLDFSREPACHKCLATRDVRTAAVWSWSRVREASQRSDRGVLTCENNHKVDLRYLTGETLPCHREIAYQEQSSFSENVHYSKICPGVCLIGLWDGHRIHRCGSGFVVDAKHGLVVTAAHVVIDPSGSAAPPNSFLRRQAHYYGLPSGQVLIGLPPAGGGSNPNSPVGPEAVWRYVARIHTDDICNVDAAVLRITSRFDNDVDNHENLLAAFDNIRSLDTQEDFRSEGLHQLKLSPRCEIEQNVRLIGYGQTTANSIDRSIGVYRGYVARKFMNSEWRGRSDRGYVWKHYFSIVTSLTLGGQSGCPCVNDQGEVIGILSQADRADKNKCFVVPTGEFIHIISDARNWEDRLDL